MLLQEIDNPGTTMVEYVQFETERALRNSKVYNWETTKYGMVNWCLDEVDIDILRFFEPKFPAIVYNDALKLKPDPSFNQMEYGLIINDDDLEYMFDNLLAKDSPSFMDVEKEEMEGMKSMMIGTPSKRVKNLDKEFDGWARYNGFVNTSGCDNVELVKK
ncbi:hypothetical protein Tco_1506628 [Tanacetum coccineum]